MQSKQQRIEIATKAARSGDESSIRVLTDEIFNLASELPEQIKQPLKERVVRAEIAFRKQRHEPISESQIADGVNLLADRFGAPQFAKTSAEQVSDLRMNLTHAFPSLLASRLGQDASTIHQFSPAEAAFLMLVMARQKVSNADYQVPPEQWRAFQKARRTTSTGAQIVRPANVQADLMHRLIANQAPRMSGNDAIVLGHQVLDAIGIQR
jgi:hypothetical protein